jgi:hypothetical protein
MQLAVQAELEISPELVADALRARWPTVNVDVHIVPLRDLLADDRTERRAKWDAVVVNRVGMSEDLAPLLAAQSSGAFFSPADPELQDMLRGHSVQAQRQLHAALYDRHSHLFLVELNGLAAWRATIQPVWMTPVDGLGRLSEWGFVR